MHQTHVVGGPPKKMRRISGLVSSVVAVVVLAGSAGLAQRPVPQDKQRDDQIQIRTIEVRLPITAKDKEKNKFIPNLTESNFEVFEDGKKQKIQRFVAPSQLPLSIAVLMDTSNSVKLKLPFEKEAAEDFIATVTTYRRKDKVLFATFDSEVSLHQDFTDAQEPLIRAIRKVKSGGYTRLYDGVYRLIEEKMSAIQATDDRRVIVVLSDGEDTASDRSLKEAIEIAQRYDVTIFGISTKNFKGIASGMVENADDKELRQLCEQTGGQVFLPSQKIELFRAFTEVAQDLRQEYVIYYTPENQEKKGRRRIKVELIGHKGRLHHKDGYTY